MNPKPKVKLCWNCEGRVTLRDENCPYCAVYLHPESNPDDEDEDETPPEPPYRMISGQESIPKAPYAQEDLPKKEESSFIIPTSELKRIMMPLALLLFGSVFLLFGFILLLFSQEGILTLRWNADIWYFYEILALPLLYFGWRCLEHLKEDEH